MSVRLTSDADASGYDGDGVLIYPGPAGPLSSIRLENIADVIKVSQSAIHPHCTPTVTHSVTCYGLV